MVGAIFEEGHPRNISVKLFKSPSTPRFSRRHRLQLFVYLKPWRPCCSTERNDLSNSMEGNPWNILVVLFQSPSTDLAGEVIVGC